MALSSGFQQLIAEAQAGSENATWRLVEALTPHIYRVVSRRMSPSLRQRVGASDIVQATWASFLVRDRDLQDFQNEDELRAFIAGIAMNKLRMQARAHVQTKARDFRREVSGNSRGLALAATNEPTVSDVFVFRESWDGFMASQPPHYQKIVQLRIDGLTICSIAAELRINERTVRRVLQKLADEVAM